MPDAFDFSALKSTTPKYLGMDALKEALPDPNEDHHESLNREYVNAEMEVDQPVPIDQDLSMVDQELSEDDTSSAADTSVLHNLMSPTKAGASKAVDQSVKASVDPSTEKTPALQILPLSASHLQSNQENHDYKYELRLPIPSPWHQNLPYILSTYMQLAYNAFFLALIAYLVRIVNNDVTKKFEERRAAIIRESTWCQHQYVINQCGSHKAPPHLFDNKKCLELEHCMDLDPENVRRLSMYASLLAEVIGEFVQPLSIRTLFIFVAIPVLIFGANFGINYLFGFVRARTYMALAPNHANQHSGSQDTKDHIHLTASRGVNALSPPPEN